MIPPDEDRRANPLLVVVLYGFLGGAGLLVASLLFAWCGGKGRSTSPSERGGASLGASIMTGVAPGRPRFGGAA